MSRLVKRVLARAGLNESDFRYLRRTSESVILEHKATKKEVSVRW